MMFLFFPEAEKLYLDPGVRDPGLKLLVGGIFIYLVIYLLLGMVAVSYLVKRQERPLRPLVSLFSLFKAGILKIPEGPKRLNIKLKI